MIWVTCKMNLSGEMVLFWQSSLESFSSTLSCCELGGKGVCVCVCVRACKCMCMCVCACVCVCMCVHAPWVQISSILGPARPWPTSTQLTAPQQLERGSLTFALRCGTQSRKGLSDSWRQQQRQEWQQLHGSSTFYVSGTLVSHLYILTNFPSTTTIRSIWPSPFTDEKIKTKKSFK